MTNHQNQQGGASSQDAAKAPTASAVLGEGKDVLTQLLGLMMLKEAREQEKIEGEAAALAQRNKKRAENNREHDSRLLLRQARCRHLKGATSTAKNPTIDYAVYQHTFINADTYIRCQICGARWRPEDTVEFLVRNGRKISNHTKIGWREASNMLQQSTNTKTMSEIPFASLYKAQAEGKYVAASDAYGQQTNLKIVDEKGNEVSSVEL
jgi:hypothetical protein